MRIVFVGASRFGLRCLEKLGALESCSVVGSVTAPETFKISYAPEGVKNVLFADVASLTSSMGAPVIRIKEGMSDPGLLESISRWNPDAFVVAGWYHMIPAAWRDIAPAFGLHASLLPDYAGGAPLVWAIINGEEKTGITLFEMGDGVDDGPVLGQKSTRIHPDETIAEVYARIENLGLDLLDEVVPLLAKGRATRRAQDLSQRRVFAQRSPADGVIEWNFPAKRVHDFIRAQTRPYPGAFTTLPAGKLVIWRATPVRAVGSKRPPGTLELLGDSLRAWCGEDVILLEEADLNGEELTGLEIASQLGLEPPG